MLVISWSQAKAAGLKHYFTGKPCKRGHIEKRFVSCGKCMECARLEAAAYASANPAKCQEMRAERYAENRDETKAKVAAWRAANRERSMASGRAYREANREKLRLAAAARYAADPDHCRSVYRAWCAANVERVRAFRLNRVARQKSAEGSYTGDDIKRIYEAQKGRCACCREKVGKKYHVDHISPLASGGSNWPSHLQILCPTCNRRKGAKDPIQFSRERGLLL